MENQPVPPCLGPLTATVCLSSTPSKSRGFALLITIVLTAFLVLLIVGLAAFTRVETQVAANAQLSARAQKHALTALSIALGQLQKYAGPDQRATARADLSTGLGNPYYTGVWDTTTPAPNPSLPMVWLVSGNENNPLAHLPTADLSAAPDAILLVDKAVNREASLQVRVRKQAIAASAPGIVDSATVGHFAYWVGDEGVKARANLVSPWPGEASAGALREQENAYNFGTAQRSGIEQMARDAAPDPVGGTAFGTTAYPPNSTGLTKVLSPQQLPLSLPASLTTAETAAMRTAYRNRFHDLSVSSASVVADQYRGGLKKDLSRLLENNAAAAYPAVAAPDSDYLFPIVGPAGANFFENPPTWGRLRSFANTRSNGTALTPRRPSATDQGIAPVLAWVEIGYGATTNLTGNRVRMNLFPRVLLWNPYNVPLADASYEIGIRGHESHYVTIEATAPGTGTTKFSLGGGKFTATPSTSFLRFRINTSGTIPPGGTRLYTLSSNGTAYDATLSANNVLSSGDRPNFTYLEDVTTPYSLSVTAQTPLRLTHSANPGVEAMAFIRATTPVTSPITGAVPPPQNYQFLGRVGVEVFGLSSTSDIQGLGFAPDFRLSLRPRLGGENIALPMRWIANGNLRAPYINRTHVSADINRYNPLYNGIITSSTVINSPQASTRLNRIFSVGGGTEDELALFQVPRVDTPLFSIADLRHAQLAPVGTAPAYPLATSLADFRMNSRAATSYLPPASATPNGALNYRLYDCAYLLNEELWDRYYFSTLPSTLPSDYASRPEYATLPNGRMTYLSRNGNPPLAADLLQPELAAKTSTSKVALT